MSHTLDEMSLAVVVKLCSEKPQVVTKAPQGLWVPHFPVTAAFMSVTLASDFSAPGTWQTFIKASL